MFNEFSTQGETSGTETRGDKYPSHNRPIVLMSMFNLTESYKLSVVPENFTIYHQQIKYSHLVDQHLISTH